MGCEPDILSGRPCDSPGCAASTYPSLTSREQIDYRLVVDRRRDIYLRDDEPPNLEDVRACVRAFLREHAEMGERVVAWGFDADAFVELLAAEKSQGNFMYLVHALEDIRTAAIGPASIDRVEDLPVGLRAYYERHWRTMQAHDPERFKQLYEPVLRLLAAAREPVSIPLLQAWTGLEPRRLRGVVRDWRQFLNELREPDGERRYRIYHASFQEFLAEEGVGLGPSHERIADAALRTIPGFVIRGT